MKPMLAVDHDPNKLVYPVLASPKLDGIRCLIHDGRVLSRSLKPIPNAHVVETLDPKRYWGLDGELIVGAPTALDVYRQTTSNVMSHDKVFDFTFHVFDILDKPEWPYAERLGELEARVRGYAAQGHDAPIVVHPQQFILNHDELLEYEAEQLALGYEGLILRSQTAPYKHGRSTVKEGYLLKVKRFMDSEAEIIGFEEQMFNGNEATTNELGRTKRSSHKAGLIGKNTLGALVVRDLKTDVEFNIGTGLDDAVRRHIWDNRDEHLSKTVKYKYFPVGVKDAPRHPVFLGFRDGRDMS